MNLNLGRESHHQSLINFKEPSQLLEIKKPKTSSAILGKDTVASTHTQGEVFKDDIKSSDVISGSLNASQLKYKNSILMKRNS